MKKVLGLLCVAVAVAALTGCSNIRATNNFNGQGLATANATPVAHINARINGCFIFGFIPLWSGSAENPGSFNIFSNNVKVSNVVWLVVNKSKDIGGTKVVDLKTVYEEKPVWVIIPMFLMNIRECQASGNSLK